MKKLERSELRSLTGGLWAPPIEGGGYGCGVLTFIGCDNCGGSSMTCDYKWQQGGVTWTLCHQSCVTGVTTQGSSKTICTS
jgi:hypothetical protein